MERSFEAQLPNEQYEIRRGVASGFPIEGWFNRVTGKLEKIVRRFDGGFFEERVYDPDTKKEKSKSLYGNDGALIEFEATSELEVLRERELKVKEQYSASAQQIFTAEQFRMSLDYDYFEQFVSPDDKGH